MLVAIVVDVVLAVGVIWLSVLLMRERRARRPARVPADTPGARHIEGDLRAQLLWAGERITQLEQVIAGVPQGVVISDASGNVVFRHDLRAQAQPTLAGDALLDQAVRDALALARTGSSVTREVEVFGPPRRTLLISAGGLQGEGGRSIGAVAFVEDVTERRRLDAVRRDFVANISHELRTPIGALALLAETLTGERSPSAMRRMASRIEGEAHRLAAVVEDLLTLSRIEADEHQFDEEVPIERVVREAVERARPASEHQGIDIVVAPFDASMTVHGDRRQLVSALHNLLDNAIKYSDKGEPVTVRVWVEPTDPNRVAVSVIDRGMGIPLRDRERIFERFYRVDRARARDTGGTGLGLSIVRHVAVNHQGDVTLESLEGEGSTFTLRLPLAQSAPATAPATDPPYAPPADPPPVASNAS